MFLLDRLDAWLNSRDEKAVVEQLAPEDAREAPDDWVKRAMDQLGVDEEEARQIIAEAKAHEREIDVAESDSDDWGPPGWKPPERRERQEDLGTSPEGPGVNDEALDAPQ